MKKLLTELTAAIEGYRMTFGTEKQLQDQLAEIFNREGIFFEREAQISPGDRPDFYIAAHAIEVKIRGSTDAHLRQLKRYNENSNVAGSILISPRCNPETFPAELAGKPCGCINLMRNRL